MRTLLTALTALMLFSTSVVAGAGDKTDCVLDTGVPEWPNGTVSKTAVPSGYRGFESHPLRQSFSNPLTMPSAGKSQVLWEHVASGLVIHICPEGMTVL
jgi:hypothetical protein